MRAGFGLTSCNTAQTGACQMPVAGKCKSESISGRRVLQDVESSAKFSCRDRQVDLAMIADGGASLLRRFDVASHRSR